MGKPTEKERGSQATSEAAPFAQTTNPFRETKTLLYNFAEPRRRTSFRRAEPNFKRSKCRGELVEKEVAPSGELSKLRLDQNG